MNAVAKKPTPAKKKGAAKKAESNVVPIKPSDADETLRLATELLEAQAKKAVQKKDLNERVKKAKKHFEEMVEQGRGNDPMEAMNKLEDVETAWQSWQDALAERSKVSSALNEAVDKAMDALREHIEDRKQVKFDFGEEAAAE